MSFKTTFKTSSSQPPPYPHLPDGWHVTSFITELPEDYWFHYSTTGIIASSLIHAGSHEAARRRRKSLYSIDWSEVNVDQMLADGKYWMPTADNMTFLLYPQCPILNDTRYELLTDKQANDEDYVMDLTGGRGCLLYDNEYEGDISLVAPLDCWSVVGVYMGHFYTFSPEPPENSLEIARQAIRHRTQEKVYDEWVDIDSQLRDVQMDIGRLNEWRDYVEENDEGAGGLDIAAAIERDFGFRQVEGIFQTSQGPHYHVWNKTRGGGIVDAGRFDLPDGEEGVFTIMPGDPEYDLYKQSQTTFVIR